MSRDEIAGGIVIFIFGAITVLLSLRMPIGTFRMAGAGMFPLCLGILLMILSGIFILNIFSKSKKIRVQMGASVESSSSPIQLVLFLATMVLITLFFNLLGYPLSAFLLMAFLLRILGVKKWVINLPLSFVTAAISYFLFVQWLKIPLPKGWLGL